MVIETSRLTLESITPELAARIVSRDRRTGDDWHAEYPLLEELSLLRTLARTHDPDPVFTLYMIRRRDDHIAIGGIGYFGPPDPDGRVRIGYGVVPAARRRGFATEALRAAIAFAADRGAATIAADTLAGNSASQKVLIKAGLSEVARSGSVLYFELGIRKCGDRGNERCRSRNGNGRDREDQV
ncbi:GNAT family N-acetyltransferase [Tsukamurella sp. 8F]|uniref:GNAT family N-acetyltransferase n=1 Tax=unclassified Tsukamurella TaxID=2633480 RepID=UPI0023B8DAFF|nr:MULTISPECIES: GNAT family N-acetyltransferase [unclassified Tsukamurella]MDF0528848.1 GNAT family N-acetyltransferase [Tsukamurella sp. 8J]MDF0586683.1 GNAT family N-acetyltransferase [Tsukamurella sp. 8F]